MKGVSIDFLADDFILKSGYDSYVVMLCKGAPSRKWDKTHKVWRFPLSQPNVNYLSGTFPPEVFSNEAKGVLQNYNHAVPDSKFPDWYEFPPGVVPRPYQGARLDLAWNKEAYALFWEQRLGKTFMAITLACAYHQERTINQLLVVCPNSIKDVWPNELQKWATSDYQVRVVESGKQNLKFPPERGNPYLRVLVVGIESLSQGGATNKVMSFIDAGDTMLVLDESSRVKNHKATRAQRVAAYSELCKRKLIMTGTPITQGMHDLYMQFNVLDPKILGFDSFYPFRNRYCVMDTFVGTGGRPIEKIVGYQNTQELLSMVANYSDVLKCVDVWDDLPERTYETRWVEPTAEQVTMFKQLKQDMRTEYENDKLTIDNILERMTRYQQIAGGNYPFKVGVDKKNKPIYNTKPIKSPKMIELMNIIEDLPADEKVIIWCRFQPELQEVARMLRDNYGECVSEFHGGNRETRDEEKWAFQIGDNRFFVGNPATGGMGLELSAANYVIYYSNSFSYEDRSQSEARAQHMDKKNSVVYIDLYVKLPIDRALCLALSTKSGLADYVSMSLQTGLVSEIGEMV